MKQYIQGLYLRPFDDNIEAYIRELPLLHNLQELSFTKPVTFFVGENGMGKSTLLEAIALQYGFNPEGGSRNFNFSTHDSHGHLCDYLVLQKNGVVPKDTFFLRAESFYNLASYVEEIDSVGMYGSFMDQFGGTSLHKQSHGESFMNLIMYRFRGHGVYLLDEPEAALSPSRQMSMLVALDQLVKQHSQLIIATHSPILMSYPNADIYEFKQDGIHQVPYKDSENYQVMKQFIEAPERMLKYLLEEDA